MRKIFRLGLCQTAVGKEKSENLKRAAESVGRAAAKGCQIVALPEMFNCPYNKNLFPDYAESFPNGGTIQLLSALAKKHNIVLVGGSIPERDDGACYNTSFIFGPGGELLGRHRKIHLFDVDLPDGLSFKESDTLKAGDSPTVVDTFLGKIGVCICYDIRFPELLRHMALQGAGLILVPAAFNTVTGPVHWELCMKSRAVDNQVFVAAISPARNEQATYKAWGHSMALDPWGDILAEAGTDEGLLCVDIDPAKISEVRKRLPLLKHRRPDLYELQW
ncbi:MAG TPA: carbon-nitrogen hydrolase family protein [Clostridia bacterium]|nr:carbon-nitrogen hydrolase family protein [Clostridia bacterium]